MLLGQKFDKFCKIPFPSKDKHALRHLHDGKTGNLITGTYTPTYRHRVSLRFIHNRKWKIYSGSAIFIPEEAYLQPEGEYLYRK